MKTITVEDIYIKLELIFDEIESGYERRLKVYKLLNNLLPKWEGNERQKSNKTTKQTNSKALHIADVSNLLTAFMTWYKNYIPIKTQKSNKEIVCPYCGNINLNSWEMNKSGDVECDECGKQFHVEIEIEKTYTSKPYE